MDNKSTGFPGGELPLEKGSKEKNGTFYKLFCRAFQLAFKVGNYVIPYRMPEHAEGPGCIRELPHIVKEKGAGHVLLVSGPHITKSGLNGSLMEALEQQGVSYTLFTDIGANPTSDMVEKGVKAYMENGCDAIIAFGGGSPMDCAKAIGARIARPRKSVSELQGLMKVMKKIPPFFAVPTTAGTGSETTIAAVITDAATHRKASINDVYLMPDYAVLDPELTTALSPAVTAATGMDALCHAVEAFTNKKYNTRLENDLARKAVRLIYDNLQRAYDNGADIEARQNMQKAAFFAGRAITRGAVGYVHAVGHTVSGLHNVPHGLAMAVILPHVMRQYGPAAYERLAILADDCGMGGGSAREKAERFIRWIDDMNASMGIPAGLDMIEDADIPHMIRWAMQEANPLYPVPVIWGREELRRLIVTVQRAGRRS